MKDNLKLSGNQLVVNFDSAFRRGREVEKEHGKLNLWNGDSSRLHVRKAGYKCVYTLPDTLISSIFD